MAYQNENGLQSHSSRIGGGASKCAAFFSEKPTEGHEIVRASYYYKILKDQSSFNDFLWLNKAGVDKCVGNFFGATWLLMFKVVILSPALLSMSDFLSVTQLEIYSMVNYFIRIIRN